MKKLIKYSLSLILMLLSFSCKKSSFLDTKHDQQLIIPATLKDFQALLDNDGIFNDNVVPSLGDDGSDDYFMRDIPYNNTLPSDLKNTYVWATNPYPAITIDDWNNPYSSIFYANSILEGLDKLKITNYNESTFNSIKGGALFHRAHAFFQLSQVFCRPYSSNTATADLGIPLRLKANITEKISRSSLHDTYNKIFEDLKLAVSLLPNTTLYKTRPSKPAALGLLARVYLSISDYENALTYANESLQINSSLMDYNSPLLNLDDWPCFKQFNEEVLFGCQLVKTFLLPAAYGRVDSTLVASYDQNDLRKQAYFYLASSGNYYKGSYDGSDDYFAGVANDEVYLIRAECYARKGNTSSAMADLNTLISKRWKTGTFVPFTATDANDALVKILIERRKELIFRGLRWTDLRRLNKEPAFAKTLVRKVNGQIIQLPPNDLRYTWPIPDDILGFNPGMPQNER